LTATARTLAAGQESRYALEKMNNKNATFLAKIIAGSILISTLMNWQMGACCLSLFFAPLTRSNVMTVVYSCPVFVLCLVGSIALLLSRRWGYYFIYASLLFLAFGVGIEFIPFLFYLTRPLCDMNPFVMSTVVLVVANLLITGVLIWTHITDHIEA
jgi:hypothetical protein